MTDNNFIRGLNLGMWNPSGIPPASPAVAPEPKPFVVPSGVNPDNAYTLEKLLPTINPDEQWADDKRRLDYMFDLKRKEAAERQKLGEESTQKALLYKQLYELPKTIMSAYTLPAAIYAQGAQSIADITLQGARNLGSIPGYQTVGMNYSPQKYF